VETPDRFRLKRLALRQFRNYGETVYEPSEGINLIAGANAQGKTNLLEAVHLVSTGRLLRTGRDAEAIQEDQKEATVLGVVQDDSKIRVELKRGTRKRVFVNEFGLARASDVLGRLPCVTFTAENLLIVRGEPAERRMFLDAELSQISPAYLKSYGRYKRALEQRNALLRRAREEIVPENEFEIWEEQMAESGVEMRRRRVSYVDSIAPVATEYQAELAKEGLELEYQMKGEAEEPDELNQLFRSQRAEDVRRGWTRSGPHRDDLGIEVGEREARSFGSQGQQRAAVIAIKLATLKLAREHFGRAPLLLLDDVFSDLDKNRRSRLIEVALEQGGQVFLTCTEAEQAGAELNRAAKVVWVTSGTLETA
jgi:DNA replication and repair protein RecF